MIALPPSLKDSDGLEEAVQASNFLNRFSVEEFKGGLLVMVLIRDIHTRLCSNLFFWIFGLASCTDYWCP